jgi:predicted transcriptional regulator
VKRDKFQIKAEILEVCKEPQTITDLLAKVGWFGGYYAQYVRELTQKGLLKAEGQKRLGKKYQTTEKGLLWLNTYKELKRIEESEAQT